MTKQAHARFNPRLSAHQLCELGLVADKRRPPLWSCELDSRKAHFLLKRNGEIELLRYPRRYGGIIAVDCDTAFGELDETQLRLLNDLRIYCENRYEPRAIVVSCLWRVNTGEDLLVIAD